jgi:hypothetical protein
MMRNHPTSLFISKIAVKGEGRLAALEVPWLFFAQGYIFGVRASNLLEFLASTRSFAAHPPGHRRLSRPIFFRLSLTA